MSDNFGNLEQNNIDDLSQRIDYNEFQTYFKRNIYWEIWIFVLFREKFLRCSLG